MPAPRRRPRVSSSPGVRMAAGAAGVERVGFSAANLANLSAMLTQVPSASFRRSGSRNFPLLHARFEFQQKIAVFEIILRLVDRRAREFLDSRQRLPPREGDEVRH